MPTAGKLVVLKFNGALQHGFQVMLEIGSDGERPEIELLGSLPSNPELAQYLLSWQQSYRSLSSDSLSLISRIQPQQIVYGGSVNRIEDCHQSASQLQQQMTQWLESSSFRRLDCRMREALGLHESIRVLIRTQDPQLRRLPWHLWNIIDSYSKLEIALSSPASERVEIETDPTSCRPQVKILAILGNSQNINVQADRQFLEALPDAAVTFLVEPSKQKIDDRLWEQAWDILFFAGHSATEGDRGLIYINSQEKLNLEELKYGLRKAISKGLQIAIFNSCDGLGLIQALEPLHVPQTIVMREPVPDRVAQGFLKYFLSAFTGGKSLYLSVREARERLQSIEDRFPCATWLPVIWQNSTKIPPTWQELVNKVSSQGEDIHIRPTSVLTTPDAIGSQQSYFAEDRQWQFRQYLRHWLRRMRKGWIVLLVIAIAVALISIRPLASLHSWELKIYNLMMQQRPDEGADDRLLIVEVTDADIAAQKQNGELLQRQSLSAQSLHQMVETSLGDRSLERLLSILAQHQPRVIGLDIYRDFSVDSTLPELATRLQHSPGLITVCKAEDFEDKTIPSIDPPPEVPLDRIGFSDLRADKDGILRRHILGMSPLLRTPASRCNIDRSFGVAIAARYLQQQNIKTQFTADGDLQLGKREIEILRSHSSIYPQLESGGSEILLNYRATKEIAERVTLGEIFNNNINPQRIKDKIVLVGVTAQGGEDHWHIPTNPRVPMPGVVVQAHTISQLVSATLDGRSILTALSQWQALGWAWTWAMVGCLLAAWQWQRKNIGRSLFHLVASITIATLCLYGMCFISLLQGKWLPFISPVLALILSSSFVVIYLIYRSSTRSMSSS